MSRLLSYLQPDFVGPTDPRTKLQFEVNPNPQPKSYLASSAAPEPVRTTNSTPVNGTGDTLKPLAHFLRDTIQSFPRAVASTGLGVVQNINDKFIKSDKLTHVIDEGLPTDDPFGRLFLGPEPVKAPATRVAEGEQDLKKYGLDKAALPLAFAGVVGGTALDLLPGPGKTTKKVGKEVVEKVTERSAKDIAESQLDDIYKQLKTSRDKIFNDVNFGKADIQDGPEIDRIISNIEKGKHTQDDLLTAREILRRNQVAESLRPTINVEGKPTRLANYLEGLRNNPEAGFVKAPELTDIEAYNKLQDSLKPVRQLDNDTQKIFDDLYQGRLSAHELGNKEAAKLAVPEKQGLQTILDYQKGVETPYSAQIKKVFDDLFQEANVRDLDVLYRQNYLPQVYQESKEEVAQALGKYLKDLGVSPETVDAYLKGKELPESVITGLKLNPDFIKERVFPNYETAMKYGLTPKYSNPAQLAGYYRDQLETVIANKKFLDNLSATGKIGPVEMAQEDWVPVNLPFSYKGFFAEPKLGKVLNNLFGDVSPQGFGQYLTSGVATLSGKAQEISLSGGIPATNVNFFSIGQLIKQLTAGDVSALPAFIRANFNGKSLKFFEKNTHYLEMMANQGIDVSHRIGTYQNAYKTLKSGSLPQKIRQVIGEGWDKAFNEKTFSSFMPQLEVNSFKQAYTKFLAKGIAKDEAERLAGETVKNMFGVIDEFGRSQATKDALSATFFAPKFREGLINTLLNSAKSVTTEIRNPAFYQNRRLVTGMALLYGLYNAANYKLNGHFMWDNEDNRQFALRIPTADGDAIYFEFMPSFLALPRNLFAGAKAAVTGDVKTATQKTGSLFSMPIKILSEVYANQDYFGNPIYKDTDSGKEQSLKIAKYVGLSVNHPFVKEIMTQLSDTNKKPLYQSVITAMELPLKFSSKENLAKGKYYDALDRQEKGRAESRKRMQPTYDKVQQLIAEGKEEEAQQIVDELPDTEYSIYKDIKASDKRRQTAKGKAEMYDFYLEVQKVRQTDEAKAQAMLDNLSDKEYRLYTLVKNQFNQPQ